MSHQPNVHPPVYRPHPSPNKALLLILVFVAEVVALLAVVVVVVIDRLTLNFVMSMATMQTIVLNLQPLLIHLLVILILRLRFMFNVM